MLGSKAYLKSPVWVQEQMLTFRAFVRKSIREGGSFRHELKEVDHMQWLGHEALQSLQFDRLRKVVQHAALHVPHYRESFAETGFSLDQLISLDDVKLIPILTKRNAFDAGENMLAENAFGPRFSNSTSGTTGMSMKVWRDLHSIRRENAFVWRQCSWAGGKPGDRRVWIRGDKVVPSNVKSPPFWRYSKADSMLMMSSYHLSDNSAEQYIRAMEDFDPVFGMVYPSALLLMARYMLNAGRKYHGVSLRGFVTSSETVTDEHRRLVQETFGCRIFDWYGSAERVTAIGNCEYGNYHVISDYGFTELVPQEDGTCEVIGTSFDNYLMPWIRYSLGDSIVPADRSYVCPCGRSFPVVESIVGRVEDYIVTPDGRHVFMMSNMLDKIPNLLEGQVRQDSRDEVKILVVPAPGKQIVESEVIASAREQLGDDIHIKFEQVSNIPRTSNGKVRVVVRTI